MGIACSTDELNDFDKVINLIVNGGFSKAKQILTNNVVFLEKVIETKCKIVIELDKKTSKQFLKKLDTIKLLYEYDSTFSVIYINIVKNSKFINFSALLKIN